jgi:hypothetical protein
MKAFITYVIIYISLFIGIVFIIEVSTSAIINKNAKFKLLSNPKNIIAGHSHPECAFNDSIIVGFKNIAQSGESYYYTYFKLKKYLDQNPSIETIFIEFTNNQIISEMDNWIWDDKHLSSRYTIYSSFISLNNQFFLIKNNPNGYLNSLSNSNRSKLSTIIRIDYDYSNKLGGYKYLVLDKIDSILNNTIKINFNNDLTSPENSIKISETNLLYLKKIIELIKFNRKNIFLIRSPQHSKLIMPKDEITFKNILSNRFNNIEYLDFSRFPLSNSEFGDLEHLNYKGAKIFSTWFNNLIENGLLLRPNKQALIDESIRKLNSTNGQ